MTDTAAAVTLLHKYLSLAPQPFLTADSQGCGTMLNAVARGLVTPPAMAGYSCNTSLYWDAYTTEDAGSQMQYIEADFGFSAPAQYTSYTAGYDPLVSAQTPGVMQSRLAAVPTLLVADSGDNIVDQTANSIAYVNAINTVRAGSPNSICVADTNQYYPASATICGPTAAYYPIGGGHVGAQEMNGTQLLTFFNQH